VHRSTASKVRYWAFDQRRINVRHYQGASENFPETREQR
jgi:hypothetical protein